MALKLQSLLDGFTSSTYGIQSFYRHNKTRCMQTIKAGQARKRKNMTFYLLQNTRNLQHIYMRSLILALMLHAALENSSTVPTGWFRFKAILFTILVFSSNRIAYH